MCEALARACGLERAEALTESEGQPLGRVGDLPEAMALRAFVERLATHLPTAAGGIRVAGRRMPWCVASRCCGGAGDDLFDAVRASGPTST